MENYENVMNAGSAASPVGSRTEDTGPLGSRPATPSMPDVSNLLMNLNQRLMQLESVGSVVPSNVNLNIALPERYNGSIGRCRDFLLAVDNLFAIQPHRYSGDEIKTRFIGTLLTQEALAWFRDVLERRTDLLGDYSLFVSEFRAFFEDPNTRRHAADALGRLKQGKGSCLAYATKFRRLGHDTGFNNDALVDFFRKGLNEDIKDRLANALEEPTELEEYISLCVKIDQRLYDRRVEKAGTVKFGFTPPRFAPRPPSGPSPMELDSMQTERFKKLTPEERKRRFEQGLCLYCGDKSHKLASCPARNAKMKKGPGLNMLSISALNPLETISIKSFVRMDDLEIDLDAMVDSGATGCFVSQAWVEEACLPTTVLEKGLSVRLANGHEVMCEESLVGVEIGVRKLDANSTIVLDCIVLPELKFDCILGLPWLTRANPDIDWASRTLSFKETQGASLFEERSSNLNLLNLKISDNQSTSLAETLPVVKEPPENESGTGENSSKERSSNDLIPNLTPSVNANVVLPDFLLEFQDVCEEREAGVLPPLRSGIDLEIQLKDDSLTPPFLRIYPLSDHEDGELRKFVEKNLQRGYIIPSNSPYAAPIFFVKKSRGGLRPCIDYRLLNENTVRDGHPLPLIADVLNKFRGSMVFSSIDLRGAYNLVRIKEGDEHKAAFRCKYGQFEPRVVQFGLRNAPAAFMRFVNSIFRDLIGVYLEVYLDDIIIYSSSLEEHRNQLVEVFRRLKSNELQVSLEKCTFMVKELVYLGYRVSTEGVSMVGEKIQAIKDFGIPRNVTEVRSFLGMANYYRKFIRDFSRLAFPLTQLTKKSLTFKWTDVENDSFLKLKDAFREEVVLKYPDSNLPFTLFCDASDQALGSVLSQCDKEGNFRAVEFFSRKLLPAELNYTVYDKELLAIVESFKLWRQYLLYSPHKIVVKSDHNNLKYFNSSKLWKPRHARWAEELAQFDFVIDHLAGDKNVVADALSRSPDKVSFQRNDAELVLLNDSLFGLAALGGNDLESEVSEESPGSDAQEDSPAGGTHTHDWPEDIAQYLVTQEWSCGTHLLKNYKAMIGRFRIRHDKLYFLTPLGWPRAYVPSSQRQEILQRFHDQLGHLGADSILDLITRRYYWPDLLSDLREYCRSCPQCQLARSRGGAPKPPLKPVPPVALPFERIGLDFVGILPKTKKGNRWCLTAVDYATRWAWAVPVPDATSRTVIGVLYHYIICFCGCPSEVITDKGRNFISEDMKEFFNANGIKHLETSPYHPSTNGMVERMHGMLNHGISALCSSRVDRWDEYVDQVLWGIRVRTHHVTGYSPFYLMFGVLPRISGDVTPPHCVLEPLDDVEQRVAVEGWTNRELEDLGVARGEAYLRTQATKENLNAKADDFYFKQDDWVKIKNFRKKKFQFSWKGPYIVHGYGYFPTYWLRNTRGEFLKSVVNQANMAPWTARVQENEDFFYGFHQSDDDEDYSDAFPEEEDDDGSISLSGLALGLN